MSWFDIIVLLILLGAFIRGMQKGLTMQLAGLVAIIIGAIFAGKAADIILPFLLNSVNISANIAAVISYVLAFTIIVFAIKFIGKMLHSLFEALHLSFLNKTLGAFVGVITASVVLSILINLAVMLDPEEELVTSNLKRETFFYSKIQMVVPTIVPYLKKEVWEKYIPEQLKLDEEEQEAIEKEDPSMLSKSRQLKL